VPSVRTSSARIQMRLRPVVLAFARTPDAHALDGTPRSSITRPAIVIPRGRRTSIVRVSPGASGSSNSSASGPKGFAT
jgi:hypothetical protein